MQAERIDGMFHFHYIKSSVEIIGAMTQKITALKTKVEERRTRVRNLREEYKITDAIYIDLLEQAREALKRNDNNRMSYSVSNAIASKADASNSKGMAEEFTIGAGVVNNLLTENDFIKAEEGQVAKLELICRNLKDEERDWSGGRKIGWSLSESELKYLGF